MRVSHLLALFIFVLAAAADEAPTSTTALAATVTPATVPPGAFCTVTYRWAATAPLAKGYSVFVHVRDAQGKMVTQADHLPPIGTATPGWRGELSYSRRLQAPRALADGVYRIVVGLYDKEGRRLLTAGAGVKDDGGRGYEVGLLTVDAKAPRPPADTERAPSLSLAGYHMTFIEEFDGPLDVSPWGPGTRWIAHTPWAGDFGDARFADPTPGFPFTISDGVLRIEARKDDKGKWRAGLLCSSDPKGRGFAQQYGYFEMRAKLPPGPGVWPAFWLASSYDRTDKTAGKDGTVELDVLEYYGHNPTAYTATMHVWSPPPHRGEGMTIVTREHEVTSGFHNYGVLVEPATTTMYFDGVAVWQTPTPPEHNKPLMVLLDLALGSGWPIDQTPSPSFMYVEYVRVWAKAGANQDR